MKNCKPSCAHRCFVIDYHAARHAQLLAEEAATIGDPEMIADRKANGVWPINFKEWLRGHKRS